MVRDIDDTTNKPRPPRPDPALVPQTIIGNAPCPIAPDDLPGWTAMSAVRPSERPIDRPCPTDPSHQDFVTSAFHFTWRHFAFLMALLAAIGVMLMIVYGGVK